MAAKTSLRVFLWILFGAILSLIPFAWQLAQQWLNDSHLLGMVALFGKGDLYIISIVVGTAAIGELVWLVVSLFRSDKPARSIVGWKASAGVISGTAVLILFVALCAAVYTGVTTNDAAQAAAQAANHTDATTLIVTDQTHAAAPDAAAQLRTGHGRAVRTAELSMALFAGTVLMGASIVAICQRVEDRL